MKAVLETWRPVPGYEGLYDVSDLGSVRSHYGGRVRYLKGNKLKNGYIQVALYKNGKMKTFYIHRLAWEGFYGTIPSGMQIDHINTVRDDNRIENLRVVSPSENHRNPITAERMQEAARRLTEDPQWRQKNREAMKKLAKDHKWRQKNREAMKKRSENQEWRQKNREAIMRVFAKPIVQLDKNTGEVIRHWECARDIERELGVSNSNISKCCRGKQKSACGFGWRFATDDD